MAVIGEVQQLTAHEGLQTAPGGVKVRTTAFPSASLASH